MGLFIRIWDENTNESLKFPLIEEGGPLSLKCLQTQFPTANGLVSADVGGEKVILPETDWVIQPQGDWKESAYTPHFPSAKRGSREMEDLRSENWKLYSMKSRW